jgi:hypothetical protein
MYNKFDISTLGAQINEAIVSTSAELTGSRRMFQKHIHQDMMDKLADQYRPVTYASMLEPAITDYTDWDFAVEDTIDNRNILTSIGCVEYALAANTDYTDALTTSVFCIATEQGVAIEFILKNDMRAFKKVWDDMDVEFYAMLIWKKSSMYANSDLKPAGIRYAIITLMNTLYKISK